MAPAPDLEVAPALVDPERLAPYLRGRLDGELGQFAVERLGEGQSCLTFLLRGDGWRLVLRRPPRGDLPPTAFDVTREYRVMSALSAAGSAVPVPRPLLLCESSEVIGAPFYVMEPVDGIVLRELPPDFDEAARMHVSRGLGETLAALHSVDWEAIGLTGFGRPSGYAERQLARVEKLWSRARFRDVPEIDEAGRLLARNPPRGASAAIVHGDYKIDNVIVNPADASIAAVVDWELSTIGDPLADLGWLLYFWLDRLDEAEWAGMPSVMAAPGFLRRHELLEAYLAQRPAALADVTWYAALAGWKVAVIMEGSYRRFLDGVGDHDTFASLEHGVPYLARRALQFLRGDLGV